MVYGKKAGRNELIKKRKGKKKKDRKKREEEEQCENEDSIMNCSSIKKETQNVLGQTRGDSMFHRAFEEELSIFEKLGKTYERY